MLIIEQDSGQPLMRKCECAESEYLERLWLNFGVKPSDVKKLNDYNAYDDITKKSKEKAVKYIENFKTNLQEKNNSFGMFGQNGAGKSHICIAIGAALLSQKHQTIYMPYVEATKELRLSAKDLEYYSKLSNRYQRAKVLIIDDLFKDKTKNGQLVADMTEMDIKHFYPILNYRYYNNLPTIFSTECTPEMLIRLDEAQAGRIIERCGDNMCVFREAKNNYRLKKFIK